MNAYPGIPQDAAYHRVVVTFLQPRSEFQWLCEDALQTERAAIRAKVRKILEQL